MNKRIILSALGILAIISLGIGLFGFFNTERSLASYLFGSEPDLPDFLAGDKSFDKEAFMLARSEGIARMRGIHDGKIPDPILRQDAIKKMEEQELRRGELSDSSLFAAWTEIGPNPIPNGQTVGITTAVSGRTIAIAVHPTNPDIVYVGTAQGGLYRSTNGGTSWTALMDGALSLAIGAIAIAPSQPETIYVGTGEPNFSTDSFFGVGVYRIDNASTTANITGPLNRDAGNADIFTGRGIGEILVHPSDPATIFVATTSGLAGIGGVANTVLPSRGIYRSTNATAATPVFAKLTGLAANANASVRDIAFDPLNPNLLVANVILGGGTGGIYTSANALSAAPTFAQTAVFNATTTSEITAEFAVIHPAGNPNPTFYAATGNLGGRVLISTDNGLTWTQQIDNNFCTPQCFYDIAIDVDPNNPAIVYLGGAPAVPFARSVDSGVTFTTTSTGLHVDSHAIAVSKSNPSVVYFGSDGGIYRSNDSGANWIILNNTTFKATQFMSIAVHPTDGNFTIGGTQDNGTNFYRPDATWTRITGGDGGYAVIDQSATNTANTNIAHTFFNNSAQQGYTFKNSSNFAASNLRGCFSGVAANGIACDTAAVLFYAPLEQGPGTPNTIYYGTDKLYRSSDNGLNHTIVSQAPIETGIPLSAIGIAPNDDNIRIVGLATGGLYGTTTGSAALTNLDPSNNVPAGFISRVAIDPNNPNTAYAMLANFAAATLWKSTNINSASPTWTSISGSAGNALPAVPANAFAIDPANSSRLYVGTDIGVFASSNAGATWAPFGTGLPRVAVFDIALTKAGPPKLRIATHGRGMWEIPSLAAVTAPAYVDFDGDRKTDISIFRPSVGEWYYLSSLTGNSPGAQFGASSDKIAPADYTGDGKADFAFFRPSDANWYIIRSENSTFFAFPYGANGDIPAPGDFDGDGKADVTIFRPSAGLWASLRSSDGGSTILQFGANGDIPVVADYDGDGKADFSVYRPSAGEWYTRRSSTGAVFGAPFGAVGDLPVQGDYTGDGKADFAIFRPSTGFWYILRSEDQSFFGSPFGVATDTPTIGDYDGDGKNDFAVFRPSTGNWFIQRSTAGFLAATFGVATDRPAPAYYLP